MAEFQIESKEEKILRQAKERMKIRDARVRGTISAAKLVTAFKSRRKWESPKRGIKRRERAVRGILTATGIIHGKQTYKGPGRPRGTFKYGMPIQVYKAQLRQKKQLYQQYQQQQAAKMRVRGFTPEQLQQLQQQQTMEELEQPSISRVQQIQERVQQMQQQIIPQSKGYGRIIPRSQQIQPGRSIADEELDFRKWSAETTISPRTQKILDTVRRIQNKGKTDNIEQQRRLRERNMVGRSMNLMKAHENMIDTTMDFTGVDPMENILMAPNVFKENPENNILKPKKWNILQTGEAGNNLNFF